MIFDSIQLLEGSKLTNVVLDSGTSFPSLPDTGELFFKTTDNGLYVYTGSAWASATGTGTVTSIDVSGGSTGLTTSGGPITASGTITLAGTLAIANGGTGSTSANTAFNNLVPSQTSNSGKFLTTNGTDTSWSAVYPTQTGNNGKFLKTDGSETSWAAVVSSVSGTANQITASASTGAVTLSLPSSITISGTVTSANVAASGAVTVNDIGEMRAASLVTSATTENQVVDTAAIATYRAVKYNVTITSGSSYQFTEVYLLHDGTTPYINQISTMRTGLNLATFDADISSGNMRLLATPTNAVTTIKVLRTAMKI